MNEQRILHKYMETMEISDDWRKQMEAEKLVYSIQEVADLLGISRSYAYQLVRNGTIPALQLGKKRVIPKEKFIQWVNSNGELDDGSLL